jgi:phosphoribosyl 1,2-cyclic phosphodiesterase
MSLFITSLNSGSNGNCYYLGNEKEAILIDAGISCREVEKRMKRLDLSMLKLKAIFISHEHTDHTRGLFSLVKKYHLPVYITTPTLRNGGLRLDPGYVRTFTAYDAISVGSLAVTAFPKEHDAADPYSFVVSCNNVNVGVFTDIGSPCEHVKKQFSKCDAVFLESNYDDKMLDEGNYPYHLKRRIRGGKGHLSNKQALELFLSYRSSSLSHLVLSHLSKNNNCPKLVSELFNQHANGTKIVVASRYEETPVYHISYSARKEDTSEKIISPRRARPPQLEFSFA